MTQGPIHFVWSVHDRGYEWVDVWPHGIERRGDEGPWTRVLIPVADVDDVGAHATRYSPIDDQPALFRQFAALDPAESTILKFANQYGWLHDYQPVSGGKSPYEIYEPGRDRHGRLVRGEPIDPWIDAISEMRWAIHLWDMIRTTDHQQLSKHIRWVGMDKVVLYSDPQTAGSRSGSEQFPSIVHAEDAAVLCASPFATRYRRGFDAWWPANVRLYQIIATRLQNNVSGTMTWQEESERLRLVFAPTNLLTALWLQFAQSVHGDTEYHSCQQCGKWFEVDSTAVRTSRVYCSSACRSKAYRHRKGEARNLAQQGIGVEEIAANLGTDPATAKRWIESSHKSRSS